ncbi:MAG: KpsF/GutQ family sugar-phosphate isomerase [Hyphomicrobiales bacterium]
MSEAAKQVETTEDVRLKAARRTFDVGRDGLLSLSNELDGPLGDALISAVNTISRATGRVIAVGVGKSGHIARKLAATFASTGTAAYYVHPTEASHGDLGMIGREDVVLALSNSGETAELKDILSYAKRFSVPLIAITGNADSTLGRKADIALEIPNHEEACPNGLAPTTSTTLQLALGDALAVALLEHNGFTAGDFAALHPGGKLGASLTYARDLMHSGDDLPIVGPKEEMSSALVTMTSKRFGCLAVIDDDQTLLGIITDGDLRRNMGTDLLGACAGDVMSESPITVSPNTMASSALKTMNTRKITTLFVVEDNRPVGILHIHDLLRAGVQ